MKIHILSYLSLGLILLSSLSFRVNAAVMAIDYGAQWFKVALVKPGVPLDLVLNRESKRKTPSNICIRDGVRLYGNEANNLATRFPKFTFPSLKNLLGHKFEDEECEVYRNTFYNDMIKDEERGTVAFKYKDETYTVEELVSYQLAQAKEMADNMAGENVKDAVITVPRFFNHFERKAIIDAAELAGIRVISLLNEDTASALNFAMTRVFEEAPQHHIFFDMGAGSTVATLISFQSIPEDETKKKPKMVPQIEVKATGYDRSLGGHAFDVKLQHHLANKFKETSKGKNIDIFSNQRAMSKLLKEAIKVKEILSANTECFASIENLTDDIDFRTKVTRAELEEMAVDLFPRIKNPIEKILNESNLSLDNITSIILVGGSTRIPKVQATLKELVGDEKIAKNVNSDEAVVLGGGFKAAASSRAFRVREIRIKDINNRPIEVVYDSEITEKRPEGKEVHTMLYNEKALLGAKKLMNFRRITDFEFSLKNKGEAENDESTEILRAKITGIEDAIKENAERSLGDPKVKLMLQLTDSNIISMFDAAAHFQLTPEPEPETTIVEQSTEAAETTKENEEETTKASDSSSSSTTTTTTSSTTSASSTPTETVAEKKEEKPKVVNKKVILKLEITSNGLKEISKEKMDEYKKRRAALDDADKKRRILAEARNNLESYVYSGQEFIYKEDVAAVTNEEQREAYSKLLEATSDWLYDEGQEAPISDLKAKLDELHALQDPIERRMSEFERRPSVLGHIKSSIEISKNWVIEARKNYTTEPEDDHVFTEEQIDSVESLANTTQVWLDETLAKQKELKDYEDPVLLVDDMITKGEKIDRLVLSMEKKRKLWKPKKVEKEEEEEESASEEETTDIEEEEEDENGEKVTKTKKVYKSKTKKSKKTSSTTSATETAEATATPDASEETSEAPATEEKEAEKEKENDKEEKSNEKDEL
ncbi:HSP70-domain-containing protein [Piromyces finnis]|uniref:HSP70-domain-containing protein n=1 Tax=Piromyces finnis TaxID=1754191 RepID=A0A1Y1V2D0_9FUNG|nr:HSP70-domain-containing protein [Piromyces finnis]|eukprot:ORX45559.1 HSP70-domain-containing protein [Piromyces finnis]